MVSPFGEFHLTLLERLNLQPGEIPSKSIDGIEEVEIAGTAGAPLDLVFGKSLENQSPPGRRHLATAR